MQKLDYKSGFETLVGAVAIGAARDIVTQHPANPVPKTNFVFDAIGIAAGLGIEGLGLATRSRALHEIGEGVLAPSYAYAAADLTQLGRNKLATKATSASTSTQLVLRGGAAPQAQVNYAADELGDF